ncbi:MAG: prepilin peptidase [Planktomarina sp.]
MVTSLPDDTAWWFLIPMVPLCLVVVWDDLSNLKIRNVTVLATIGIYIIVGLLVMPWTTVLFQLSLGIATLAVTFILFNLRIMGGGDAKYIAAIVPFFWWNDWAVIVLLFCAITLGTLLIHRIARALGAAKLIPSWDSWTSGKRFPMGFPLGLIVMAYLGLSAYPT